MVDVVNPIMFLERLGFADILLWLLTFAVVYGILSQINIPKDSKESQAIIAAVIGFLILLSAPAAMISMISQMSGSLILVGMALLIIVIFLEVAGLSETRISEKTGKPEKISFLSNHPYLFVAIMVIIFAVIFVSAGGLGMLGLQLPTKNFNVMGAGFIIAIIAAVAWMVLGKKDDKR